MSDKNGGLPLKVSLNMCSENNCHIYRIIKVHLSVYLAIYINFIYIYGLAIQVKLCLKEVEETYSTSVRKYERIHMYAQRVSCACLCMCLN